MTDEEKAKIILEALDEYMQVNWNFEKYYMKAIKNGLREIKRREQKWRAYNRNSGEADRCLNHSPSRMTKTD